MPDEDTMILKCFKLFFTMCYIAILLLLSLSLILILSTYILNIFLKWQTILMNINERVKIHKAYE